jgi:hypothetical protein
MQMGQNFQEKINMSGMYELSQKGEGYRFLR